MNLLVNIQIFSCVGFLFQFTDENINFVIHQRRCLKYLETLLLLFTLIHTKSRACRSNLRIMVRLSISHKNEYHITPRYKTRDIHPLHATTLGAVAC